MTTRLWRSGTTTTASGSTAPPAIGSGSVTSVNITPPTEGLAVSGGPITASGSLALQLANDLAAIEALTGSGLVRRTGPDAWSVGGLLNLASEVTGLLPVARGGTGTATPGIVAGTNVTVSGSWPNQTVSAAGGGGGGTVTSVAATAPAAGLTVSGSPITGSGTLAFALADDLAALEALTGTGVVRRTGANAWSLANVSLTTEVSGILPVANGGTGTATPGIVAGTNVSVTGTWPNQTVGAVGSVSSVGLIGPAAGITVAGGNITGSGSHTLALANDLAAVEALASTGIVRRTAAETWSAGTAVDLGTEVSGLLPVARGGTGTASPGMTAGANVTLTGTWPNQTIAAATPPAVVNDLITGGTTAALSAQQGVVLKGLADGKEPTLPSGTAAQVILGNKTLGALPPTITVVNDDTTGGAAAAWSAARGAQARTDINANATAIAAKLTPPASPVVGQVITWNGTAWVAQDQNKPAVVTVSADRALAAGDIGAELRNAAGTYTLTLNTALGTDADAIFFAPTGTGAQTVTAGTGVTLYDARTDTPSTVASFNVPANGFAAIERISSTVWRRV